VIGEIFLLVVVTGLLVFVLICYFYFFKRAKSVDAQRLNDINFGRTSDYIYPVEDNQIKLVGKQLSEEEIPKIDLSGWGKEDPNNKKDY
jgi:hypothetical protein